MKVKLIGLLLLALFPGCVTQKKCNSKFPPVSEIIYKDSIIEREVTVYVDTIIYVELPAKEVVKEVKIPVPITFKSDTVYAVGDYASAKAWIAKRELKLKLNEGARIKLDLEKAIRETTYWKEKYVKDKKTEIIEVNKLRKWQIALMITGLISIILFILKIAIDFTKK
ncbi:MAG TPA: hypothetical protein PLV65_05305 [Tenuifilaceae bacterium]|nr:hypothetical protein [Tenuifilaceae bacterium]